LYVGRVTQPYAPAPTSDTEASPRIAIAVLTYNRVHLLRACVENVLGATSASTREIVIWNNGSSDGTREYLDGLDDPRLRVVHSDTNIGLNGYARAFALTSADYLVQLDDDIVDAPPGWDATLLDAYRRLPAIGYLSADLCDDPHDVATHYRYHVYEYTETEVNGVRLLLGPVGGACAITSRELNERAGGFRQRPKQVVWLEDEAYIGDIKRLGFGSAVLAGLEVHHTGGDYYGAGTPEKDEFWAREWRRRARRTAIKRVLFRLPLFRRLNARFGWCVEPE
jgi:GT2 family glycosyltransferase